MRFLNKHLPLTVMLAGAVLAALVWVSGRTSSYIGDGGTLARTAPGEDAQTYDVRGTGTGQSVELDVTIDSARYSDEELETMYEQFIPALESAMLADNASLDDVDSNLNMVSGLKGYPFKVSWETDDYNFLTPDGEVMTWEEVSDKPASKQSAVVEITATITCYDTFTKLYTLYAHVVPKPPARTWADEVREAVDAAIRADPWGDTVTLPPKVGGEVVTWSKPDDNSALFILILGIAAGVSVYVMKKQETAKAMARRREAIVSEYPALISKLCLYLGAGMNLRNAWIRIAEGGLEHSACPLYEEMTYTEREWDSGVSEAAGYERFGKRIGDKRYMKLATLLAQNLKKGNAALLSQMRAEAAYAEEDAAGRVRKAGELASTKLLVPMMMLLAMTLILIMIPAFWGM